jgi:hypothetical protein
VTNTAADCEDGDVDVDEFDDEPQPAPSIERASKSVTPRNGFMANSNPEI